MVRQSMGPGSGSAATGRTTMWGESGTGELVEAVPAEGLVPDGGDAIEHPPGRCARPPRRGCRPARPLLTCFDLVGVAAASEEARRRPRWRSR